MMPDVFDNTTYKTINQFIKVHLIKTLDELRREINLQEAVTDKLIQADSMLKHPKIVPIRSNYKELFQEKEEQPISPEELTRKMREIMKR